MRLSAITPDHLGNGADQILTLTGAGFDATTTVTLKSTSGTVYKSSQVELDLPTQLTATFNAGAVPPGQYAVLVRADGANASLAGAFTVVPGGKAQLQTNLIGPSFLGYHLPATLYLEYSNTGDLAMPAPIIEVTISQTHSDGTTTAVPILTLNPSLQYHGYWTSAVPDGFTHTVEVLASGATLGVLEPGESIKVPIYYDGWQQPWDGSYPDFHYQVGVEQTTDTTPIPWSSLAASLEPPDINAAAWAVIVSNLETQVGSTWGDFVERIDDDASYLGRLGENVTDLGWLWSFEVEQAAGFSPLPVLVSDTEASVLSVGPALSVDQEFVNTINGQPDRRWDGAGPGTTPIEASCRSAPTGQSPSRPAMAPSAGSSPTAGAATSPSPATSARSQRPEEVDLSSRNRLVTSPPSKRMAS